MVPCFTEHLACLLVRHRAQAGEQGDPTTEDGACDSSRLLARFPDVDPEALRRPTATALNLLGGLAVDGAIVGGIRVGTDVVDGNGGLDVAHCRPSPCEPERRAGPPACLHEDDLADVNPPAAAARSAPPSRRRLRGVGDFGPAAVHPSPSHRRRAMMWTKLACDLAQHLPIHRPGDSAAPRSDIGRGALR